MNIWNSDFVLNTIATSSLEAICIEVYGAWLTTHPDELEINMKYGCLNNILQDLELLEIFALQLVSCNLFPVQKVRGRLNNCILQVGQKPAIVLDCTQGNRKCSFEVFEPLAVPCCDRTCLRYSTDG